MNVYRSVHYPFSGATMSWLHDAQDAVEAGAQAALERPVAGAAVLVATLAASGFTFAWSGRRLPGGAGARPVWAFEWQRRKVGLWSHLALFLLNVYVMWFDRNVRSPPPGRDLTTVYSAVSHAGYLVAAGVYLFDTFALVLHPRKSARTKAVWAVHHAGSLFLLGLIMRVRMGSFPAACFMVSSATHVTCNLRWFHQTVTGRKGTPADKALGLLNAALFFAVAVAPIPYMFARVAADKRIGVAELLLSGDARHIRRKCVAGTLAIFVPHVLLFFRIARKELARLGEAPYVPKRARPKQE